MPLGYYLCPSSYVLSVQMLTWPNPACLVSPDGVEVPWVESNRLTLGFMFNETETPNTGCREGGQAELRETELVPGASLLILSEGPPDSKAPPSQLLPGFSGQLIFLFFFHMNCPENHLLRTPWSLWRAHRFIRQTNLHQYFTVLLVLSIH